MKDRPCEFPAEGPAPSGRGARPSRPRRPAGPSCRRRCRWSGSWRSEPRPPWRRWRGRPTGGYLEGAEKVKIKAARISQKPVFFFFFLYNATFNQRWRSWFVFSQFRSSSIKSWYSIRGTVFQSSSCPQHAASLLSPLFLFFVCHVFPLFVSVFASVLHICFLSLQHFHLFVFLSFISISRRVGVEGGGGHLRRHQLQNKHACLNLPWVSFYCCKKREKKRVPAGKLWAEKNSGTAVWSTDADYESEGASENIWPHRCISWASSGVRGPDDSLTWRKSEGLILCQGAQIREHLLFNRKDVWCFISWTACS